MPSPLQRLEVAHDGLHSAMQSLINKKDTREVERLLRIVDALMISLIEDIRSGAV